MIYNGQDLFNADETSDYCKVHMDAYNETKALAEVLVLEANGREGLLTCSIRPSGIFGPRDSQGSLSIVESAMKGQWRVMIGKNNNLFDLTYVDNVSHAHLLAADKMELGSGIEGQVPFSIYLGFSYHQRSTHFLLGLPKTSLASSRVPEYSLIFHSNSSGVFSR